MKQFDSENTIFWSILLPLLCVIVMCGICIGLSIENRAQRKRINALERYIIKHTDQANLEVIELLRNIEEEN